MSEKTVRTVRTVYGCVLSFLLILTGVCLIFSALSIYFGGGESPYTPEAIGARFAAIALPVWITLGAVAVGIVLRFVLPSPEKRDRAIVNRRALLSRMEEKKDTADEAYVAEAKKERRLRLCVRIGTAVLSLAAAIPAILHLSDPESFRYPEYNASVIAAMPSLLLFSVTLAILLTVCAMLCEKSYQRQTKLLSLLGAREASRNQVTERVPATLVLRLAILALSLVLLIIGIAGGGMEDVLAKAINICTECIGLG